MPNLLLTSRCVRACPYCFAREAMAGRPDASIAWEDLVYVADFLQSGGETAISLLGGEPTLHPDFVDFVLYLARRRFNVTVFTSGVVPPGRLAEIERHLAALPVEGLTFVCNLNHPEQTPGARGESDRVLDFLAAMGPWTSPGFNIYRTDFDLAFLVDRVNAYGLKRSLRLGVAHPIPGKESAFIRADQMEAVAERLYSFRPLLERFRIQIGLDCGFPLCRFRDEHLGWLLRQGRDLAFGCSPAIDIAPDMTVFSCFPLHDLQRRSLFAFDRFADLVAYFDALHAKLRGEVPGLYPECDECYHREAGLCAGGGVCQVYHRMTAEASVRMPEIEDALAKTRMPL